MLLYRPRLDHIIIKPKVTICPDVLNAWTDSISNRKEEEDNTVMNKSADKKYFK